MKRIPMGLLVTLLALSVGMPCYGDELVLMFPKLEQVGKSAYVMKMADAQEYTEVKLLDFVKKFREEYKVDQIELWIDTELESGGITKLFVSFGGGGGCKVILKPKR